MLISPASFTRRFSKSARTRMSGPVLCGVATVSPFFPAGSKDRSRAAAGVASTAVGAGAMTATAGCAASDSGRAPSRT